MIALALAALADSSTFIRVNQLGYLPDAPKAAVVCSLDSTRVRTFTIKNERGQVVFGPTRARAAGAFGPCVATYRLDFTRLQQSGSYIIVAGDATSPMFRIGR